MRRLILRSPNATVTFAGTGTIYTPPTITPDGNDGEITIAIAAGVAEDAASKQHGLEPSERDL
ncbi:MAG: hypothetical protein ACNYPI_01410 [Arenicellales bacterium WSBS_2016_MAG_OTU3]